MKVVWFSDAWSDYVALQADDPDLTNKINALIKDVTRSPFQGIGKPEPLKLQLKGWWSRRISREHRFVYRVEGSGDERRVEILSCRFHY
ncbi:Txe/YoeB family addiction module toxin [Methylopila sp. Yamaguchi]|uniref:Txe/YoeB family addiction module toxin n=1 Tax=Methylopila sp. Yamaguchi TaxID=1437817 RepID=UPI000CB382D2|nr:Txe/YoeB family addiction module toxin [Methylopila sp. Yamaguchi]GBD49489.1 addiction module toxin, Txe/YoeB family [Methylopila sp. Yamaguchi]